PGRDLDVLKAGAHRAGGAPEIAAGAHDARALDRARLDVGEVDDRLGPRVRFRELRRARLRLVDELHGIALERPLARLHPAAADQRVAEPREARALVVVTRPEGEHVELLDGVQRVRAAPRVVDDAVAGADLRRRALLPREAAARDH